MPYMVDIFFVYEHEFSNGVRYVGKGVAARPHRGPSHRKNSPYWLRLYDKYGAPIVKVLAGPMEEDLALLAEVERIAQLKRLGVPLANLTDGGDGVSGYTWSSEERAQNSQRVRRWREDNPATVSAITENLVAYNKRPEVVVENVARLNTAEVRAKTVAKRLATTNTPEFREAASARAKRMWSDPAKREQIITRLKTRDTTKLAAAMSARFTDKNKHPRTDHTMYCFVHKDGRVFRGKRIELCDLFGVNATQLSSVVSGRFKSTLGWSIHKEDTDA